MPTLARSALAAMFVLLAAAAPARADDAGKVRTLVMDLKSNGVEQDAVDTISGLIAVILDEDERLEVLSGADVKQLIALESQKQAMGCADDSSCLADVAGALGAELVVFGAAGKLGTLYNLNLNLYDSRQGRSVGRVAVQAGSLEQLPGQLRPALANLVKKALASRPGGAQAKTEPTPPPTDEAPPRTDAIETPAAPPTDTAAAGPGVMPYVVAGTGGALAVAGTGLLALSFVPSLAIGAAQSDYASAATQEERATALEGAAFWQGNYILAPVAFLAGAALVLGGAGVLAGGLAWSALDPSEQP